MAEEFDAVSVDQLDTITLALEQYLSVANVNGKLYKSRIGDLVTFITPFLSGVNATGLVFPDSSNVLPNPTATIKGSIVGAGTFTWTGGTLTTTGLLNIIATNGTSWYLVKAVSTGDLLSKSEYNFGGTYPNVAAANSAIANTVVNGKNLRDGKRVDIGTNGNYVTYWWNGGFLDQNLTPFFIAKKTLGAVDLSSYSSQSDVNYSFFNTGSLAPENGHVLSVSLNLANSNDIKINCVRQVSGNTWIKVSSQTVTGIVPGINTITLDIPVIAGDGLEIYTGTNNIGYKTINGKSYQGFQGESTTQGVVFSPVSNYEIAISYDFVSDLFYPMFRAQIDSNSALNQLVNVYTKPQVDSKLSLGTIVGEDGTGVEYTNNFALGYTAINVTQPIPIPGFLLKVSALLINLLPIKFGIARKSGDSYRRIGSSYAFTPTNTGLNTFDVSSLDVPVLAGDFVYVYTENNAPKYRTAASGQSYISFTGELSDTPTTASSGGMGALTVGFSYLVGDVFAKLKLRVDKNTDNIALNTASISTIPSIPKEKTALVTSVFNGTALASGWSTSGTGWTNTADGLKSPSRASTDFSFVAKRAGEEYTPNQMELVFEFKCETSNMRAVFGMTQALSPTGNTSYVQIDRVNNLIKLHGAVDLSGATEPAILASASLSVLGVGSIYTLEIVRNYNELVIVCRDFATTALMGTINYGSNSNIVPPGNIPYAFNGTPAAYPMLGQFTLRYVALSVPVVNPLLLIDGDSTAQGVGDLPLNSWPAKLISRSGGLNLGQQGSRYDKYAFTIPCVLNKLKPKVFIANSGFNNPSDISAMQSAVAALKTACDNIGCILVIVAQWPHARLDTNDNTAMTAAQIAMRASGIIVIRGDLAISLNNAGVAGDPNLIYDTTHLNNAGNVALENRIVKIDLPQYF